MAPTGGGQNSSSGPQEMPAGQVAASNLTLNAWIGGRRQRSWMTNAAPVKPTPRPPQPPKQQSQLQQPTQTTTPPLSTTAIQQPSNPTRLPQSQHLPQPGQPQKPQQQQQRQQPQQHYRPTPGNDTHQPRLFPPQSRRQSQLAQTGVGNSAPEAVLPSPAPSDEPSPSIATSYESPNTVNSALPPSPADAQGTDTRYFVFDAQFGDPSTVNQRQVSNPTSALTGPGIIQSNPHQSKEVAATSGNISPSPTMVLNTPPTPSVPSFGAPVPLDHPQVPAAKRRRVE
ncbi:hypothetical protein SLS62_011381 [Diatrype stigma]|uniref:Uncharacterized protein n=1 Tax=Diatrype stigma TaxID=117547 RepID=A0AAN9U3V5_9PEZI